MSVFASVSLIDKYFFLVLKTVLVFPDIFIVIVFVVDVVVVVDCITFALSMTTNPDKLNFLSYQMRLDILLKKHCLKKFDI